MFTVVTIVHILACVFLVVVVLLQTGKGADIGAVFGGGSSSTLFGSSGAGNFLTRLTTATAIVFMLTSLILTYGAARQTTATIFDRTGTADTQTEEPTATAATGEPAPAAAPAEPAATETEAAAPAEAATTATDAPGAAPAAEAPAGTPTKP
jgi:preprotein translocase subunit SecG